MKTKIKITQDARPLYTRAEEALGKWINSLEAGERLPTEPELAKDLGISRATLREAMRLYEERGRLIRRPGVGTFISAPPPVIESGLEVLESIDTLAHRLGLRTRMMDLSAQERAANEGDKVALGLAAGASVMEISRVIYAGDSPIAFLTDVLPSGIVAQDELEDFSGSVLDMLIKRNDPHLAHSRTSITSESADGILARHLSVQRGTPLLHFEATLYAQDGRAIDHSHSYFVPGYFKFHVVRKVGK
ncbi:MAG: GntR family transcriptional regulator [Chloroflexi bacterium]|nr:GntR family transcriptional regulator [Chloroflexota bacterium]